jgi:HK97 family phage major capsid protein
MSATTAANDTMVRRLQEELQERSTFANGIIERANAANRDLTKEDQELLVEVRGRMTDLQGQLDNLLSISQVAYESRNKVQDIGNQIDHLRGKPQVGEVEYRSSGAYIVDAYQSHMGNRDAQERIELFHRAAAHQKTSDNLGVIPNPVVGEVINFVDGQRPLVQALGPRPLPGARWSRPRVTQHTTVALQGTAGAAADEKSELVSQKMVIGELTGAAKTYGGYVNVSRQNIDFSSPDAFDIIVNDLALQYALETEGAVADLVGTTGTTAVTYDMTPDTGTPQEAVAGAIWSAAGTVYSVVKGAGRLILVFAPDRLAAFGPLFAPVNPQNGYGTVGSAANFGQGVVGQIAGVTGVMSAGLASGEAFLLSTAAIEVYEQRIGQLQVVEPSVLGVQVAYAGYFTPMLIDDDAIVPLEQAA